MIWYCKTTYISFIEDTFNIFRFLLGALFVYGTDVFLTYAGIQSPFDLGNGVVTPRPDVPDKTMPDGARQSQTKKWLVLSGFLHQKFAGNFKKVVQMMPDSTRISLCLQKRQNLVLFGTIWPTSLQTSGAGSQTEPAIFLSGSVWLRLAWFCLVRLVLV